MDELLTRGIDQIIGRPELEEALKGTKKLRIKFGVDPTRPDIHIGHAVVMRKLREFQELGHTVIFLIGDYTTKIGDPSGRNNTRPMLTDEEIRANAQTYLDQAGLIIDLKKAEVRYNSEWLAKLDFAELIRLAGNVSVAQLIERDDFSKRLAAGQELALHELLYPLVQAYDSVALEADVEFGGSDQLFNLLMGRSLQKKLGQTPQIVVTAPLLVGLDGVKKMSKSLDNYVGITQDPLDMYGRIMSVTDNLIAPYYELCTDVPLEAIRGLVQTLAGGANPRDSKASLAREIVRTYHGDVASVKAEEEWNRQFRDGGRPAEIERYHVPQLPVDLIELLVETKLASSKTDARGLVGQGGVRINDIKVDPERRNIALTHDVVDESDPTAPIHINDGDVLQVGKRRYLELKLK